MYCVLCNVYCVLCIVYCVLCIVYCVLYIVYCILCIVYTLTTNAEQRKFKIEFIISFCKVETMNFGVVKLSSL